jgi:hypothetical protein
MNTYADKTQENKSRSVSAATPQLKNSSKSTFQFADNRPETVAQRKLQEMANNSPRAMQLKAIQDMADNSPQVNQAAQLQVMSNNHSAQQQQSIQKKENNTGLPDNLKTGMENLSGMSLDDVNVHRNSDKPAHLQAHAYAQGTDIHLGPGQEKHLPHEAWHVVQQKQGRVKATIQMKGKVNVNDDAGLEKEADVMGAKALNTKEPVQYRKNEVSVPTIVVQRTVTPIGSAESPRYNSDKVVNENSEDGNYDTEAEALAAEESRLNPAGLSKFDSLKARAKHKYKKKIKGDSFNTLKQEQEELLNQGAVKKEQGMLRHGKTAIKGASMGAKAVTKVAGTALGGPAGTAVGFALSYAIGKAEKAATASLDSELESRANLSFAILGSDKDKDRAELSEPRGESDEPQGYIDEGLVIQDAGKRAGTVKAIKKMTKKIESYSKEQIKAELDPKPVNADLLLNGSPEEIAASLLWEGIKLGISKGKTFVEGRVDEAADRANREAYRQFEDLD